MTITIINQFVQPQDITVANTANTRASANIRLPQDTVEGDLVYVIGCSDTLVTVNSANGFNLIWSSGEESPCSIVFRKRMTSAPDRFCNFGTNGSTMGWIAIALRGTANQAVPEIALLTSSGTTGMPDGANVFVTVGRAGMLVCGFLDDDAVNAGDLPGYANGQSNVATDTASPMLAFKVNNYCGYHDPGTFTSDGVGPDDDQWYSITLGIAPYGSQSGYSKETKQFLDRIPTQTNRQALIYDATIRQLVSSGLWTCWDALYLFAAADSTSARTNLISSSFTCTAVGSPTFTVNQGYTGDGATSYLDTNFNPTTAPGALYTQSDAFLVAWDGIKITPQDKVIVGNNGAGTFLAPCDALSRIQYKVNGTLPFTVVPNNDSRGFYLAYRFISGISIHACSKNDAKLFGNTSDTETALDNSNFTFLKGAGFYYPGQVMLGGFGSLQAIVNVGGTAQEIYGIFAQYLQALGNNVQFL